MRIPKSALLAVAAAGLKLAAAECPNACSGHGQCGSFDMCTCDRNWQGSDCSLRTCPFGLAHVDTPKGDLDSSTSIEEYNSLVVSGSTVYPYGTSEAYPLMADTAGTVQTDTAHDYMECSNKGLCDRKTGMCECLPGYDGAACHRASCPSKTVSPNSGATVNGKSSSNFNHGGNFNGRSAFTGRASVNPQHDQCSGHGTCETISTLAFLDNENFYDLWDKDTTMGCKCDAGYTGPDCSERVCKSGIDPLYTDDTTARVTHTTVRFESSDSNALSGTYAIKFYDITGEDYLTAPLEVSGTGSIGGVTHCDSVKAALLALPNGVIPTIECSQTVINTDYGFEYTLTFNGNPGTLRELELDQYLDGARATVSVSSGTYNANVYTKVLGEEMDYFATRCEGLTVKVLADSADGDDSWTAGNVRPGSLGYLTGPLGDLTAAEKKILKACLGDSDHDPDNNVDVANWDTGVVVEADGSPLTTYNMIGAFPHAIKVVPVETSAGYDKYKYGEYHLVWYDAAATNKEFRVANLANGANLRSEATEMYVYTTKGTVQQLGWGVEAEIADNSSGGASSTRIVGYFDKYSNKVYTNYDTSCENQPDSPNPRNFKCLDKGSKLFVVDGCWSKGDDGAGTTSPFFGGPDLYNCADSTAVNFNTGNLYTVSKVSTVPVDADSASSPSETIDVSGDPSLKKYINTYVIELNANLGWEGPKGDPENSNTNPTGATRDQMWSDNTGIVTLFHFDPPSAASYSSCESAGSYPYVSECSNRGICDTEKGICECFKGYTSQDCSVQNALAMGSSKK